MKKIYTLRVLAWIGMAALVAILFWMAVAWCIPPYTTPDSSAQIYTIRHQDLRDNNPLYTNLLLKGIKEHDGYLVLGTSETNELPNGNYFDFLNADTTIHAFFSVIGGAGRTPCTYFPLIQSNENVRNLKLLYFVNPSYWCNKLAKSNADYFHRYVSITEYRKANHPKDQDVDHILKVNRRNVRLSDRIVEPLSCMADRVRRKYHQDLAFALDPTKFYHRLTWADTAWINRKARNCTPPDSNQHNYSLNISSTFNVYSYMLRPYPEEQYRYDELRTMVRLCREHGVDATFVVGPYNRAAFEQIHPEYLNDIQLVVTNTIRLLEKEGAQYIDCSELSANPATFDDWQHPNSYGAFLIYQKIREYVLEKENR